MFHPVLSKLLTLKHVWSTWLIVDLADLQNILLPHLWGSEWSVRERWTCSVSQLWHRSLFSNRGKCRTRPVFRDTAAKSAKREERGRFEETPVVCFPTPPALFFNGFQLKLLQFCRSSRHLWKHHACHHLCSNILSLCVCSSYHLSLIFLVFC